jgi:hypothetical protein
MFRASASRLAVGTFTRFLLDTKGKFTDLTINARGVAIGKAYRAAMADPASRKDLARRAANTKIVQKPAKKRLPNALSNFRAALFKAKIYKPQPGKKGFAAMSKQTTAIWKKYCAARAENKKSVRPNETKFDLKLARTLAK